MYTILADGNTIYNPRWANTNKEYAALNPRLSLEVNKAGSLSFMILPSNTRYDDIKVLKTIITVEQDGKEIFRGRVTDITTDIFLQKTVYTEGELAFLIDSIQRPYEYEGAVHALFSMLIESHNAQVDEEKRFTVGNITAVSAEEVTHVKVSDYSDTFTEISSRLLDVYGGYIKTRVEGKTRYIDYVSDYGTDSTQAVAFGENMVTLDAGGNATDIFTVLIPLGAAVKGADGNMKPLDITSVNGGLDYIEDAEGILKYGRIVRTYTWSHIDNANELLSKARDYLAFGIAENSTLTIRAVDMHLLDGTIDAIRLGGYVNIQAAPQGITRPEICARMDIDLISPENTVYTFGLPKKSLTDNVVQVIKKVGGGGGGGMTTGIEEEILWLERWAEIYRDEDEARIEFITGQIDRFNHRVSNAEIILEAVEPKVEILVSDYSKLEERVKGAESSIKVNAGSIELHSQAIDELDGSITSANLRIDGVEGSITTLTTKQEEIDGALVDLESSITQNAGSITALSKTVDKNGETLSSAVLRLDGVEGDITAQAKTINLKADKTYVDNLFAKSITTENLSASLSELDYIKNSSIQGDTGDFETVKAQGVEVNAAGGLSVGGLNYSAHSHVISVSEDGTVTFGAVTGTPGNFKIADTKAYKDGVSAAYTNGYNAGWAAARAEVRRVINSTNKQVWIYGPAETVGSSARFWTVDLNVSFTNHNNPQPGYITANVSASVLLNNSTAITKTANSTISINSGML